MAMRPSLGLIAFALIAAGDADAQSTPERNPIADEVAAMHWIDHGNTKLTSSHSTLSVPPNIRALTDKDARRLSQILNGDDDSSVEAIALDDHDGVVYFTFTDAGYVSLDDWADLDPAAMIAEVRDNTEKANAERQKQGTRPLHVDGWIQQPTLDRANNQAHWAFSAHHDDGSKLVNAVAIQLGRNGFEKLIWAGDAKNFETSDFLGAMMQARSFDEGSRYSDHTDGDKVAGYGIAALVGAIAGAKVLKVVGGVGLLLLLKKFFWIPLLLAAGMYKRITAFFRRGKPPTQA
jgi:uncharacterized membrane-anchored protein